MKKILIISLCIILISILSLFIMYLIDMKQMKEQKPIIFSTWGYAYGTLTDIREDTYDYSDGIEKKYLTNEIIVNILK